MRLPLLSCPPSTPICQDELESLGSWITYRRSRAAALIYYRNSAIVAPLCGRNSGSFKMTHGPDISSTCAGIIHTSRTVPVRPRSAIGLWERGFAPTETPASYRGGGRAAAQTGTHGMAAQRGASSRRPGLVSHQSAPLRSLPARPQPPQARHQSPSRPVNGGDAGRRRAGRTSRGPRLPQGGRGGRRHGSAGDIEI